MAKSTDLIGIWATNIPGVIVGDKFSPGAADGDLAIFADGTFKWSTVFAANKALKQGTWQATGLSDYPLELSDTDENIRWRIGPKDSSDPSKVYIVAYKQNGDSKGFYYSGSRRASLPGATVDNGTIDAAPLPTPVDTTISGLRFISELTEPTLDADVYRLTFEKTIDLPPVAALKVGESALISVNGTFTSSKDADSFLLDFSQLTRQEQQNLASQYSLILRISPGASLQRPVSVGGQFDGRFDDILTRTILASNNPYKNIGEAYTPPGLGFSAGASAKLTISQQNIGNATYRLDIFFYREDGNSSAMPHELGGTWRDVTSQIPQSTNAGTDSTPSASKPDQATIVTPDQATIVPFPDQATIVPFPIPTSDSTNTKENSSNPTNTRPSIPTQSSTTKSSGSRGTFYLITPDTLSGRIDLTPDGKLVLNFSKEIDKRIGTVSLYDTESNNAVRWMKLYDKAITIKGSTLTVDFNYSEKLDTTANYTLFLDAIRATDGTYADFGQSSSILGFGMFGVTYVGSAPATGNNSKVSVGKSGDPILEIPGVGKARVLDFSSRTAIDFSGIAAKSTLKTLKDNSIIDVVSLDFLNRYSIKSPDTKKEVNKASSDETEIFSFTVGVQGVSKIITEFVLSTQVKATSFVGIDGITGKPFDYTYDPKTGQGAQLLDSDNNGLIDAVRFYIDTSSVASQTKTTEIRGTFADAPLAPVYRFYRNGVHLYTTNIDERDNIIQRSYGALAKAEDLSAGKKVDLITGGLGYSYEGVQYQALETQGTALYRFFNPSKGYHFNTVNETEAMAIVQNSVGKQYDLTNAQGKSLINGGWGFQYEGNSFKVSTISQEGMKAAVYRFFNPSKGVHFYSSNMVEVKSVISNSIGSQYATDSWISSTTEALRLNPLTDVPNPVATGWGFKFEGIAWFASA